MPQHKIKENFRWAAAPDFQVVETGKNTVTIKGVAVKGNQISRNKRKYVDEELLKGARTFVGVPITINHAIYERTHPMYDGRKVVGNVRWMEYEDGRMEYLADIKKQPYVDLIRNKSIEVRGVSIEADYLYNKCGKCGKNFYDTQSFEAHMIDEHFTRNFHYEPRGIVGRALSLVVSPEEPGVPDTTIQIAETFGGFSQLLETVIKTNKEIEEMKQKMGDKAVITPITRITPDRARALNEADESQVVSDAEAQDPETEQNPPLHPVLPVSPQNPEEEQADTAPEAPVTVPEQPETKVIEQEEPMSCPEGFHLNEDGTACVADEEPKPEEPMEETVEENPENQLPVPHPVPEPHVASDPEEEQAETIPEDMTATLPAPPEIKVMEITLPTKLRLGEPFSGYSSFEDCVSKNQDRDDPAAYCAVIKQKTEKETLQETLQPHSAYARDMEISSTVNQLTEAIANLALTNPKELKHVVEYVQNVTQTTSNRFTKNLKVLETHINKNKTASDKKLQALETIINTNNTKHSNLLAQKLKETQTTHKDFVNKTTQQFNNLATEIAKRDTTKSIEKIKESMNMRFNVVGDGIKELSNQTISLQKQLEELKNTPLKETVEDVVEQIKTLQTMKETFEKLLSEADKNAEERDTKIKSLEERLAESEKKTTKESTDKLTALETKIDNLADKIKPNFKAVSQREISETKQDDKPFVLDPNKGGK